MPTDCCAANVLLSLREMPEDCHLAERDEYIGRAVLNKRACPAYWDGL
jgi:hypothetical protein